MDYIPEESVQEILKAIASSVSSDLIFRQINFSLAMPGSDIEEDLDPAILEFLKRMNFLKCWNREKEYCDLKEIQRLLSRHISEEYTRKGIVSFVYFTAHFDSPLAFLIYLQEKGARDSIEILLKEKTFDFPFLPNNFTTEMNFLLEFASSEDDREEIIKIFEGLKTREGFYADY